MYTFSNASSLVDDYTFIWELDSALDQSDPGFVEKYRLYMETGDESHLPLKPGLTPVRWKFRHLRGKVRRKVLDLLQENHWKLSLEAAYEAVALSIIDVNGLKNERDEFFKVRRVQGSDGHWRVIDEDLEKLDSIPGLINAMAGRIVARLTPSPNS